MKQMLSKHARLLTVAIACVALGAGISAIASAGATTTKPATTRIAHAGAHGAARVGRRARLERLATRAVSVQAVIHTKAGFETVSAERGKVDSVSGQRLTLTEGTKSASYRTVTVTIPATARVRDDGQRASLSAVTAGQRVLVVQGPKRMFVIARTPKTS